MNKTKKYLVTKPNLLKDIIMTMSDEVLSKRMKTRGKLTEFDKIAAKSNEIYKNLNLKLKNVKRIHIESNEEDSLRKFEGAMGID
jgi:deoxyadenosine/deoxycytidine kinase